MGAYKNFDAELYRANDTLGVNRVLTYLGDSGVFALRNDDQYGVDINVFGGFKPLYHIEVEIKQAWKNGPGFPFPTVNLPERKRKFAELPKPVEFWVLSSNLEWAIIVPDFAVTDDKLAEVSNKYIAAGEKFFQVPVSDCIIKYLGPPSALDLPDGKSEPVNSSKVSPLSAEKTGVVTATGNSTDKEPV